MSSLSIKLASLTLMFIAIFLSGFWNSHTGKPYRVFIFSVHKLIGLAGGIYLISLVYRAGQTNQINQLGILAILISVMFFAGLIVSGGLLSTKIQIPTSVAWVHKAFPYLALLSTGVTIYFLS